jgi:hypothetical protein
MRSFLHFESDAQQFIAKEAWGAMNVSKEGFVRFKRRAVVALVDWWTMWERSRIFTGGYVRCVLYCTF